MLKNFTLLGLLFFSLLSTGQNNGFWQKQNVNQVSQSNLIQSSTQVDKYSVFQLNESGFKQALSNAPKRFESSFTNVSVSIPYSENKFGQFEIFEVETLAPALASNYPSIKSYVGVNINDRSERVAITITSTGVHAKIFALEGSINIDPMSNSGSLYKVFNTSDATLSPFNCEFENDMQQQASAMASNPATSSIVNDSTLRTYRFAAATTAEYSEYHWLEAGLTATDTDADKKAAVLAALIVSLDRINSIVENELAIRFQFIPTTDNHIFLDPATDPYSDYVDTGTLLAENIAYMPTAIGNANYDIGHVFGKTPGNFSPGGVAGLGSLCFNGDSKAAGVTTASVPEGELFNLILAHEIGHQLGAPHSYNNSCGGNRSDNTAYETGSGVTIMGYAGICAPNVIDSSERVDHYHAANIIQMFNHITNNATCGQTAALANTPPTLTPLSNFTIPKSTPFVLDVQATDPNSDNLTYNWEQYDKEISTQPPVATAVDGPSFRGYDVSTSPTRYFPRLNDLLQGEYEPEWEVLPSVARDLNFIVTVRDNNPLGGQVMQDTNTLTVDDTAGPFRVTSQNTAPTTWQPGTSETITWDVANTTNASVNAQNVDILLSLDSGQTFTTNLATNTPNDGTHDIIVPSVTSSNARIMIKASDNVFFDVSSQAFSINAPFEPIYCEAGSTQAQQQIFITNTTLIGEDLVNLNNTSAEGTEGIGYSNFTNISTTLNKQQTYSFNSSTTFGNENNTWNVWIDYNNNGDFTDAGEHVVINSVSFFSIQNDITIPSTANLGNVTMRVRLDNSLGDTANSPCGFSTFGEVEDYTITIQEVCLVPDNLQASNETLTSFDLTWDPVPNEVNGYEWVVMADGVSPDPNNAVLTNTVGTGVNSANIAGLNSNTDYDIYVRTDCDAVGIGNWSDILEINLDYCEAGSTQPEEQIFITNTTLLGDDAVNINNSSNQGETSLGYSDYTNLSTSVNRYQTYSLNISTSFGNASNTWNAWIDYNQNGDFTDPGEHVVVNTVSTFSIQQNITIPETATLGNTTMRVRLDNTIGGAVNTPCGFSFFGEVEDYTLNITNLCFEPTNLTSSNLGIISADLSWDASTTEDSGYEYVYFTDGTIPDASTTPTGSVSTGTTSVSLTGLQADTAYTAYVRTVCGGGDSSDWSVVENFSTLPIPDNHALSFDGVNDYVSFGNINEANFGTGDFTIEFWVKTNQIPQTYSAALISKRDVCNVDNFWNMRLNTDGTFSFEAIDPSSGSVGFSSNASINDGSWKHIAAVKENTTVTLYIDGVSNATNTSVPATLNLSNTYPVRIGRDGCSDSFGNYLEGNMDEVRIWNTARTVTEIQNNRNTELVGNETGLMAYYTFDEGLAASNNSNISAPEIINHVDCDNYGTMNGFAKTGTASNWVAGNGVITETTHIQQLNTWLGTTANWNTPSNWSTGEVPTECHDVVIPDVSNQPIIDNLTNAFAGSLTLNSNTTLDVEGVLDVTRDISNHGEITFKSNITSTGQFDEFTGTITGSGEVTVERYIPAKRAFRLLASPVTTTDFIYENWQQNGLNPLDSGYVSNSGIQITGGLLADGFDQSGSNNPSMFTFDNSNTNGTATQDDDWSSLLNTNATKLVAGEAYLTFVRGDRSIDLTTSSATPTNTTLRATGDLHIGVKSFDSANPTSSEFGLSNQINFFSLVGNPYQAIVNMNNLNLTNINPFVYWVWDPNLGVRGNYTAISLPSGVNTSSSEANQYVQPGQSFFVQTIANGSSSLTFNEDDKAVNGGTTTVFSSKPNIKLLLYTSNAYNAGERETDGVLINFDENANNGLDLLDADKLYGPDENLARMHGSQLLSLETRDMPVDDEVLPLYTINYTEDNYTFVANAINIQNNFEVYLLDNYTGIQTQLNEGGTAISFNVDANIPESLATDRFSLVFDNTTLGVNENTFGEGFSLYPNPSNNGQFSIKTPNLYGEVKVEITSLLGQNVYIQSLPVVGNQVDINATNLSTGVYVVKLTQDSQSFSSKLIVE